MSGTPGDHVTGLADHAISVEDPRAQESARILERHLAFAHEVTPPGHVHALDPGALAGPDVTFFGARRHGRLLAVGALRMIEPSHAELKSMHTLDEARGSGLGRSLVRRLVGEARDRGATRVSLETGTYPAFAAARDLYASEGFERCAPFAEYTDNEYSVCMSLEVPTSDERITHSLPPIDHGAVDRFWQNTPFGADAERPSAVEFFGDSAELASQLATLVVHGSKRATAGDLDSFERDGIPLPESGSKWVVLDGLGTPCAVLETTEVRIGPLGSVDDEFAWDEGEGDRTRDWWLAAHTRFFRRNLPPGDTFDPDMAVVFERFTLAYARPPDL